MLRATTSHSLTESQPIVVAAGRLDCQVHLTCLCTTCASQIVVGFAVYTIDLSIERSIVMRIERVIVSACVRTNDCSFEVDAIRRQDSSISSKYLGTSSARSQARRRSSSSTSTSSLCSLVCSPLVCSLLTCKFVLLAAYTLPGSRLLSAHYLTLSLQLSARTLPSLASFRAFVLTIV